METEFEFLLEILSEEIPALLHNDLHIYTKKIIQKHLDELNVNSTYEVYSNNLRLLIYIPKLPQQILIPEIKGPKLECSTQALQGFINKYRIKETDLIKTATHYIIPRTQKDLVDLLPHLLQNIIKEISQSWPRSIKCNNSNDKWIRPIRNIMCVICNEKKTTVVPVSFANLIANNQVHSAVSINRHISTINNIENNLLDNYSKTIKQYGIDTRFFINDNDESINKQFIETIIEPILYNNELQISLDESYHQIFTNLLTNCVYNSQSYHPIINYVDERFLDLPNGIIMLTLINHQKYIPLITNNKISAYLSIAQLQNSTAEQTVRNGIGLTVSARLEDAVYFYQKDKNNSIEAIRSKLKQIVFHELLGTMFDRIEQMLVVSKILQHSSINPVLQYAVEYFKFDTASNLVQEFDEFEGHISSHFVAQWIKEDGVNISQYNVDIITIGVKFFAFLKNPCDIEGKTVSQYSNSKLYQEAHYVADHLQIVESLHYIISMAVFAEIQFSSSRDPFAIRNRGLKLKQKLKSINQENLLSSEIIYNIAQGIKNHIPDNKQITSNFVEATKKVLDLLL